MLKTEEKIFLQIEIVPYTFATSSNSYMIKKMFQQEIYQLLHIFISIVHKWN